MLKELFSVTLLVTLAVNLIFLFVAKDKPPDPSGAAAGSLQPGYRFRATEAGGASDSDAIPPTGAGPRASFAPDTSRRSAHRRLFLRSNEFYDYASGSGGAGSEAANEVAADIAPSSDGAAAAADDDDQFRLPAPNQTKTNQQRPGSRNELDAAGARPTSLPILQPRWQRANSTTANDNRTEQPRRGQQMDPTRAIADDDAASSSSSSAAAATATDEQRLAPTLHGLHLSPSSASGAGPTPSRVARRPEVDGRQQQLASGGGGAGRRRRRRLHRLVGDDNHDLGDLSAATTTSAAPTRAQSNSNWRQKQKQQFYDSRANQRPEQRRKQTQTRRRRPTAAAATTRMLDIRVKSSKNHVFISVDGQLIYESKQQLASGAGAQQQQQRTRIKSKRVGATAAAAASNQIGPHHDLGAPTNKHNTADDKQPAPPMIEFELEQTEARGLHVIVLNQFDGSLMSRRIFDTYSPGQDLELCLYLSQISDGRLLVLAVKDEASFQMPSGSPARKLLKQLGSRRIQELKWRDMWALVVRKWSTFETSGQIGQPSRAAANSWQRNSQQPATGQQREALLAEGLSKATQSGAFGSSWAEPVTIGAQVELLDHDTDGGGRDDDDDDDDDDKQDDGQLRAPRGCSWRSGGGVVELTTATPGSGRRQLSGANLTQWSQFDTMDEHRRRAEFCSRIEGYGRVCDCKYPAPIGFNPAQIESSQLANVPLVVIASNRPYYLYRMLRSLLQADGVNSSMVIVFIDGFYEEPMEVCKLFNLRVVQQQPAGRRSARISHHYKMSLMATFELFPSAQFALIFEEDLDIARDSLIYFNQTMPLLGADPSLYCISAWNDQGYEHSVQQQQHQQQQSQAPNEQLVYRIETMPGLGWMLSRRLFEDELKPKWPSIEQPHDWDMWIRTESIRRGRECLIPDISRTFHFGSTGTNINSYFQKQYFSKHAFSGTASLSRQVSSDSSGDFMDTNQQAACSPILPKFTPIHQLEQLNYENLIESLISQANVIRYPKTRSISDDDNRSSSLIKLHENNNSSASNLVGEKSDDQDNNNNIDRPDSSLGDDRAAKFLCSLADSKPSVVAMDHQQPPELLRESSKTNVIFIKMIDQVDFKNWLKLANCWRLWDLDARGQHRSMWRLFLNNQMTLVVGVPASPYSHLKPANLVPFDL